MAHDVFISHSKKDKPIADAVCAALENGLIRCWIAPRDVQPGRSFAGEITRALQNSKAMVLIFSAHSNGSEQVLREVQLAVKNHLHIVQFRIERVVPSDDFAYFLSTPHWLDALTPPLEAHIDRLTASIKVLLAPPDEVLPQPTSDAVVPRRSMTGSREEFRPAPSFAAGSFLQNNRKLIGLTVGTALGVLLIWWFFRPARPVFPPEIAHYTPAPVSSPLETPEDSVGPNNPPRTTGTAYPSAEDYYRQQIAPSVAPQAELSVRRRFILQHEDRVNDAHFSADGRFIITASDDNTAQIWDAKTGKAVGEPLKHNDKVRQAIFTPDGRRIMTVSNEVRLWDAGTLKEIGEPLGARDFTTAALSPDGKLIAITQRESNAIRNAQDAYVTRFWDTVTRQIKGGTIRTKDHYGKHILVFSPDAKRIITDYDERQARIWNIASGEPVGDWLRHKQNVTSASFSPDGGSVATWADQTKPRVWNVETGEQLLELETRAGAGQIIYSPDGKYLAAIPGDNEYGLIFDARTGSIHGREIPFPYPPTIFTPNSKQLLTYGYQPDAVSMWQTETGAILTRKIQHDGKVEAMNFNSDGTLLVTASEDHTARVWEIGSQ